ncbi:MAG: hypothetical protein HYY22_02535 [Thaumarchaeota archaeon]|nr:hypothetical protein [Nitrososphaerota archaeon]
MRKYRSDDDISAFFRTHRRIISKWKEYTSVVHLTCPASLEAYPHHHVIVKVSLTERQSWDRLDPSFKSFREALEYVVDKLTWTYRRALHVYVEVVQVEGLLTLRGKESLAKQAAKKRIRAIGGNRDCSNINHSKCVMGALCKHKDEDLTVISVSDNDIRVHEGCKIALAKMWLSDDALDMLKQWLEDGKDVP